MPTREAKSFCRTCIAQCGVVLTVDANDKIVAARADRDHRVSKGYACFKGLQAVGNHYGPSRLLHSRKRRPDGGFDTIPAEQAFDEITTRLSEIRARHGAESIALFRGTAGFHNSTAFGSSTNVLIRTTHDYEALNAMPRMSAIPVRISAADRPVCAE